MKLGINFRIEDYNKFPELQSLWNKWTTATVFLSTGNCSGPAYMNFVEYCKNHREEFLEFTIDLLTIDPTEWYIMSVFNELYPDVIKVEGGYVPPSILAKFYIGACEKLLGRNKKLTIWQKCINFVKRIVNLKRS